MGLEITTNKIPGVEIRRTPASAPAMAGAMILALTVIIFLFIGLIFSAVYSYDSEKGLHLAKLDALDHDPAIDEAPLGTIFKGEQTIVSFWLACTLFSLFFVILLYQRYFLDHVTIAKKRFRKWEDEGVQF